jgi:hypothetical protein
MEKTPSFYCFRVALHIFFCNAKRIPPHKTGSSTAFSRSKVRAYRIRAVPILFADILFQDFPRGGFGQTRYEFEGTWALVVCQARTTELDEFSLSGAGIWL